MPRSAGHTTSRSKVTALPKRHVKCREGRCQFVFVRFPVVGSAGFGLFAEIAFHTFTSEKVANGGSELFGSDGDPRRAAVFAMQESSHDEARSTRPGAGTSVPSAERFPRGKVPFLRRRFFTFLSALSLLLCVAVCVLWVRSYWVAEMWRVGTWRESEAGYFFRRVKLTSGLGGLRVWLGNGHMGPGYPRRTRPSGP
jgi:hypothetical protein